MGEDTPRNGPTGGHRALLHTRNRLRAVPRPSCRGNPHTPRPVGTRPSGKRFCFRPLSPAPVQNPTPRPALLAGLIDYAGLFPPAALALDAAAAQFVAHRAQPEAWMLARFVVPATQAGALAALLSDAPVELALLGTGGADTPALLAALDADLAAFDALRSLHPHVSVAAYEVRMPADALAAGAVAARLVEAVATRTSERALPVYLEVPLGEATRDRLPALLAPMAGASVGVKYRTGGLTADAFPSCAALADALNAALAESVPFKCTAGLHHPVRMHRDEVGARMHGFLNVFGGAALVHAGALDPKRLANVLADEDAAAWGWTDDGGLRYRDASAPADAVRRARRLAASFGSCSFDDPVDDLRALGLL